MSLSTSREALRSYTDLVPQGMYDLFVKQGNLSNTQLNDYGFAENDPGQWVRWRTIHEVGMLYLSQIRGREIEPKLIPITKEFTDKLKDLCKAIELLYFPMSLSPVLYEIIIEKLVRCYHALYDTVQQLYRLINSIKQADEDKINVLTRESMEMSQNFLSDLIHKGPEIEFIDGLYRLIFDPQTWPQSPVADSDRQRYDVLTQTAKIIFFDLDHQKYSPLTAHCAYHDFCRQISQLIKSLDNYVENIFKAKEKSFKKKYPNLSPALVKNSQKNCNEQKQKLQNEATTIIKNLKACIDFLDWLILDPEMFPLLNARLLVPANIRTIKLCELQSHISPFMFLTSNALDEKGRAQNEVRKKLAQIIVKNKNSNKPEEWWNQYKQLTKIMELVDELSIKPCADFLSLCQNPSSFKGVNTKQIFLEGVDWAIFRFKIMTNIRGYFLFIMDAYNAQGAQVSLVDIRFIYTYMDIWCNWQPPANPHGLSIVEEWISYQTKDTISDLCLKIGECLHKLNDELKKLSDQTHLNSAQFIQLFMHFVPIYSLDQWLSNTNDHLEHWKQEIKALSDIDRQHAYEHLYEGGIDRLEVAYQMVSLFRKLMLLSSKDYQESPLKTLTSLFHAESDQEFPVSQSLLEIRLSEDPEHMSDSSLESMGGGEPFSYDMNAVPFVPNHIQASSFTKEIEIGSSQGPEQMPVSSLQSNEDQASLKLQAQGKKKHKNKLSGVESKTEPPMLVPLTGQESIGLSTNPDEFKKVKDCLEALKLLKQGKSGIEVSKITKILIDHGAIITFGTKHLKVVFYKQEEMSNISLARTTLGTGHGKDNKIPIGTFMQMLHQLEDSLMSTQQ